MLGVEEACWGLVFKDQIELPREIVGVLDTGVCSARAEGRDLVCAVAREDHTVVAELVHAAALEGIDGGPDELVLGALGEEFIDAGADVFEA